MKKSKVKVASSRYGVASAIVALRELIKLDYGIDVGISVAIHNWPTTLRMAKLVVTDMVDGAENWETDHRTAEAAKYGEDLHFISADGVGRNDGLGITIYKCDADKSRRRLAALPRKAKGLTEVAYSIVHIRSMIREFYGVDSDIHIKAKVDLSKYYFIPSVNPELTKEQAANVLSSIQTGTNWEVSDHIDRYNSFGYHRFCLRGRHVEFEISFPLQKDELSISDINLE